MGAHLAGAFTTVRDGLGIVGALATLGALLWGIYTWRHRHTQHVEVTVENALPTYGAQTGQWCFSVRAVNRGDYPVNVTSAGFVMPDGRELVIVAPPFGGALPSEVPPRDSRQTWLEVDTLEAEGLDVYGPVTGWVRTSTNERFSSKPRVLRSRT